MWQFIKYEWWFWLRSPMTWILLFINTLLIFGAVTSDSISIGGGVGSVHKNAPYTIQTYYAVMSLICLLMTTAYMNATATRDFQHNMYQLVFSTPIRKRDYFFGKFIGAMTMAVIPLLGVSLGSIIGPFMPWVEPQRYGPFMWEGHVWGILSFAIPNVFITGVLLFSLAMIFRNSIVSFVGAMLILVLYAVSAGFTKDIRNEWLANILDPLGFRPESLLSKYMTVDEKNTRAVPLSGPFLWNRLIWMGISLALLFILYVRFSFNTRKEKAGKQNKVAHESDSWVPTHKSFQPEKSGGNKLAMLGKLTSFELKSVVRNPTFIIITILGGINLIASLTSFTTMYGGKQYPVTYDVIETIRGSFYLFLIGIITFYSGVLVWKERDAKFSEIQDATPIKSGMLFSAKLLAMILAVALVLVFTIVIGMSSQLMFGYTRLQPDVYLKMLLGIDLTGFAFLIVVALLLHYVINNRYIAYFAFVVFIILNTFLWSALEIQTNMIPFGESPSVIYSDMNGFGPFVAGIIWFKVYWSLAALLLVFVTRAFYLRGRETSFRKRLSVAGVTLQQHGLTLGVVLIAFFVCSGFVYYNTQVLNKYDSIKDSELQTVDYEKKYKRYEGVPQPRWYALDYQIDIEPYARNLYVHTRGWVRNISGKAISELYFTTPPGIDSIDILVAGSKVKLNDTRLNFRILSLTRPLLPGDTMEIVVKCRKETKGFENEVSFTQLTQNGTFFNETDFMPILGYADAYEMQDKNKRQKYKLPVRKRMPTLNEHDTASRMNTYISNEADWVSVHTIISTAKDQIAVAPGSLLRSWEKGDKKYYEYQLDHKSLNFYSFISARYEVAREKWNGIDIEVYYYKEHAYNVPNMLRSIKKSLDYYISNFGPYYHKQARIIEFPRYGSFAQAFPGTMPYSEGIGFITDLRDVTKDDIDFVYYVVAHEMGHQYWAHQLCGANMQGSEMMSEGFAQYSSLMVMEKEYGHDKMKQFLEYEMDGYLRGRSGEAEAERPLIRTENQGYIHYQKASVVMYYLKEMIGEQQVNKALRSLLDTFAYKQPPYATSLSALRAFKAVTPDSLQYLITDMFEHVTLFSNRVASVTSKPVGKEYEVTIRTVSEKFRPDTLGKERPIAVNDYMDVGLFMAPRGKEKVGKPIQIQRVHVRQRDNTYTFRVAQKPDRAGIDPYNYLIDRIPDDNIKTVD